MERYKDPQMREEHSPSMVVPDYTTIQLNDLEIKVGTLTAKKRSSNNKKIGVKPNLVMSDEEKADREGLLREEIERPRLRSSISSDDPGPDTILEYV